MENFAGYKVGDKVICNGYDGTVTKLCEWSDGGLVEVRLARGGVCVCADELRRFDKEECRAA